MQRGCWVFCKSCACCAAEPPSRPCLPAFFVWALRTRKDLNSKKLMYSQNLVRNGLFMQLFSCLKLQYPGIISWVLCTSIGRFEISYSASVLLLCSLCFRVGFFLLLPPKELSFLSFVPWMQYSQNMTPAPPFLMGNTAPLFSSYCFIIAHSYRCLWITY